MPRRKDDDWREKFREWGSAIVTGAADAWLQSADEAYRRMEEAVQAEVDAMGGGQGRERRPGRKRRKPKPPTQHSPFQPPPPTPQPYTWAGLRWTPPPGWVGPPPTGTQPPPTGARPNAQQQSPPPPRPTQPPAPSPWEVLGVKENMPLDVCEVVYKRLSLRAHSDVGGNDRLQADLNAAIAAIRKHYGASRAQNK